MTWRDVRHQRPGVVVSATVCCRKEKSPLTKKRVEEEMEDSDLFH